MNLQLLKSFIVVAKCKNFTQAAQFLNFTQPAISNHITLLEKIYAVTLFKRDGKTVYLTNAGKALLQSAEKIMSEYEQSIENMKSFHQHQLTLRIAVSTQFINYLLVDVLCDLHRKYANLAIEVERCMTVDATLQATFVDKIYDLAFIHLDAQPLYTKRKILGMHRIVWVVSQKLFAAMNYSLEIYDYPLIGYVKTGVYIKALKDKIDFSRFVVKFSYSDSESVKAAILKGLGISILPEIKVRQELQSGELIAFPPEYAAELPISMLYEQNIEMTPVIQTLFDLLDEYTKKSPAGF